MKVCGERNAVFVELEVDGVVGLEEHSFGAGWVGEVGVFELERAVVGRESDRGLGYPSKSFCKRGFNSVEEHATEAKAISNCARLGKGISYFTVERPSNTRMQSEPTILESL